MRAKILFMAFAAFVFFIASAAQVGKSYKAQNIDAHGQILDGAGNKVGSIEKDGTVKNLKGEKVAFIAPDGTVTDAKGKRLGKAEKNGNYYDANGTLILKVNVNEKECEILDKEGHKVGTVHQNYKMHACAIHCLNLESREKEKHHK